MSKLQFDSGQFRKFFRLLQLGDREAVVELRALSFGGRRGNTFSGYFDDEDAFVRAAEEAAKNSDGVYCTINCLNQQLLCRSANRAKPYAKLTTSDADVLKRRYIPIDLDALRPAGTSSSDEQHNSAIELSFDVFRYLDSEECPEPIVLDSGNGAHLLVPFHELNDQCSKDLVQDVLGSLAEKFNNERVKIDESVFNAARIMRLPGTMNRKGDDLPRYPHRMCRILSIPESLKVCAETSLIDREDK